MGKCRSVLRLECAEEVGREGRWAWRFTCVLPQGHKGRHSTRTIRVLGVTWPATERETAGGLP